MLSSEAIYHGETSKARRSRYRNLFVPIGAQKDRKPWKNIYCLAIWGKNHRDYTNRRAEREIKYFWPFLRNTQYTDWAILGTAKNLVITICGTPQYLYFHEYLCKYILFLFHICVRYSQMHKHEQNTFFQWVRTLSMQKRETETNGWQIPQI